MNMDMNMNINSAKKTRKYVSVQNAHLKKNEPEPRKHWNNPPVNRSAHRSDLLQIAVSGQ